jgi:hypothetical protein
LYIFLLKQKNYSKVLAAFHVLIGLILLFDFWHAAKEVEKDWLFSAVALIASGFLIVAGLFAKKLKINFDRHLSLLLFEAIVMSGGMIYFWSKESPLVAVSHALLGGDVILFWIYLKKRKEGERIAVTERKIIVPSLLKDRIIHWSELTNLVKKDDLLTLDFKNNKLMQTEVFNNEDVNEEEFNRFCQQQLARSPK